MRGVRSLSGLAGANASLKDAGGGGGAEYGSVQFIAVGATSWTVPDGVTTIYAVCVGGGGFYSTSGGQSSIKRGATVLCSANGGDGGSGSGTGPGGTGGVKDGGGDGGDGTAVYAGGAGGYSGAGGTNNGAGSGGGGGSGASGGGGVGIWGEGTSGAGGGFGGSGGSDYYTGTSTQDHGGNFGGGGSNEGGGGELSWVNDVSVTPGEVLTITVGAGAINDNFSGGHGAVAIYWGNCGTFPDLANVPKPF